MSRGQKPFRLPTNEETRALQEGRSGYYMRKNFGIAEGTYNRWKHDLAHAGEVRPELRGACDLDTEETPTAGDRASWRQLIHTASAHAKAKKGVDTDVTELAVHLGDKPTGLFLTSDWHVGADSVDLDRLLADAEYVGAFRRTYPGALQLGHLGDMYDGYLPGMGRASAGMGESVEARIDRQEGMALEVARTMAGQPADLDELDGRKLTPELRWLVMLYGCHPGWQKTTALRDPLTTVTRTLGATNGGYGVVLVATVGEIQYRGVLRHRTRRESALNTTNAQRAIDDDTGIDPFGHRADFVSLSHLHNNDLQERNKSGRPVIYTRSGAYKGGDDYARAGNFQMHKTADPGGPVLVMYPDHKEIVPFSGKHWKRGLDFLAREFSKV